ncbi:MAG: hypothetical protein U0L72_04515 [Acutalibacteraceae bacterium]|nr:hypothetical protein [Acutalibacteraceae bacterium]
MMTIAEKAAYIKGLCEGLSIDDSTKEGKVLAAIVDLLGDIAVDLEDTEDACAELAEQINAVDEDLAELEDFIYEEYDETEDECEGCCGCDEDEDDELYEVECPNCHDVIYIDDRMLEDEGMTCPNCGTNLEFDLEEDCEEE